VGRAVKPRFAVVFLMILTIGLSLGLPAEDVLDAVYDESEALPYEVVPLFSIALRAVAFRTTQESVSSLNLRARVPFSLASAHVREMDARRFANGQVSLALLCTLLC
jgi:hypothetical protein